MTQVSIREASRVDTPTILQFLHRMLEEMACMGGHAVSEDAGRWATMEKRIRRAMFEQDRVTLIAETAGAPGVPVGFIEAHVVHLEPVFEPKRVWHIGAIYVAESHRRKGVGRALLEASLERGRELGCAEAELNTLVRNPARILYEQLGFREFEAELRRQL